MKTTTQLVLSTASLAGLVFAAAANATNLAELPLKVSALAKPNVIFGMDDSGSMDWESVLRTDGGQVWWDGNVTTGTSWDSTNNRPLESSGTFNPLSYLFPLGTATGAALYGSGNANGRGIPPIAQLAWTRSSAFNPLYYNTMVTYKPWSTAYVGGAQRTYSNASTSAAPSHPAVTGAPTLNVGADWNSTNANWSTDDFRFRVLAGMALPVGTRVEASTTTSGICTGGTERTLTAVTVVGTGSSCRASIPYYPATFWQRTVCPSGDASCVAAPDCTAEDPKTNPSASCVAAPDGVGNLRRYEIKSGNTFPSGRSHAAELQNFANWFTYYRKRKLMLAASMGEALEPITGIRLGVVPFNNRNPVTMWDADATNPANNKQAAAGQFYLNSMAAAGTPTNATMQYIGGQFNTNTNVIQFACQRNSMFVVTDGFANDTGTAPAYTKSSEDNVAPFTPHHNNSLSDLALAYYRIRPRTDLPAGLVPPGDPARTNPITNTNLHVTTYAITLGARGTLYPNAADPFSTNVFTTPPTWPAPVADDPTMIDDLWHATVNGRGRMFLATESKTMGQAIQDSFNDLLSQEGSQASIGVSSVNLGRGDDNAYLGVYNVRGWTGDLTRNQVDNATGAVTSTQTWPKSAATQLAERTWTDRLVFTSNDSSGVDISDSSIASIVGSTAKVNWIRGDRSAEGTTLRARASLIGAVVNAEPVVSRADGVVYLASGEGQLHAFNANTGAELWSYHPAETLAAAGASAERGWVFRTLLDATPTFAQLTVSSKMLIGGLGAAGRSYYALDVSNPKPANLSAAIGLYKWRFPKASDTANAALMGFTVGSPVVARLGGGSNVVLVTSGYDNGQTIGDGKGRVWMLDAANGDVLKTFVTSDGTAGGDNEAGLAHISAFKELDGSTKYAYGADLRGNLWRFDLTKSGAGPHAADLIATFFDANGNRQPVTAAPELVWQGDKRVIMIGTGRLLDINDLGAKTTRQSFYAIADVIGGTALANARSSLTARSYVSANETGTKSAEPLTGNNFNWTNDRGWYFDLPADEHANTNPIVTYGAVVFVTNKQGNSDCSQASYLYLVDIGTGKKVADSTFVRSLISDKATSSRVITLRTVNGKIVGTTHKSDNSVYQRELPLGTSIPPSKNAWRELRR